MQAVALFKSYFGGAFDEDAIRNNFVLIYELLDGMFIFRCISSCIVYRQLCLRIIGTLLWVHVNHLCILLSCKSFYLMHARLITHCMCLSSLIFPFF